MKYSLVAVGKIKKSPEYDLLEQYRARLTAPLQIHEIPDGRDQNDLLIKKLAQISGKEGGQNFVIGLDERGQNLSSPALAEIIQNRKNQGASHFIFIIGGADGLNDDIRGQCDYLLSFGKLTWPHMMVRGMLAEQIYRIQQILNNHPYHRA